jgi:alpha-glucosidase
LHLAFNFQLIVNESVVTPWRADVIRQVVSDLEQHLPRGAQPCYALNNHDRSRFISRNNLDGHGHTRARAACLLLLGLRATPFVYYGEEIGMVDVDIPEDRQQDPARFRHIGRDPQRTPMQWDDTPGRGFSNVEPWLPVGPADINVAAQQDDPDSMLSLYRDAIRLRRQEPALHDGSLRILDSNEDIFAWERVVDGSRPVCCVLNTATGPREVTIPAGYQSILLSTDRQMVGQAVSEAVTVPSLGAVWIA